MKWPTWLPGGHDRTARREEHAADTLDQLEDVLSRLQVELARNLRREEGREDARSS